MTEQELLEFEEFRRQVARAERAIEATKKARDELEWRDWRRDCLAADAADLIRAPAVEKQPKMGGGYLGKTVLYPAAWVERTAEHGPRAGSSSETLDEFIRRVRSSSKRRRRALFADRRREAAADAGAADPRLAAGPGEAAEPHPGEAGDDGGHVQRAALAVAGG